MRGLSFGTRAASAGGGGPVAPTLTFGSTQDADEGGTGVAVFTATATGGDTPYVWSISGGADAALFSINSSTGVVTRAEALWFNFPKNVATNSQYAITVRCTSATAAYAEQATTVSIQPLETAFVSAALGDDGTGVINDHGFPFETVEAAAAALWAGPGATGNSVIRIRDYAGSHFEAGLTNALASAGILFIGCATNYIGRGTATFDYLHFTANTPTVSLADLSISVALTMLRANGNPSSWTYFGTCGAVNISSLTVEGAADGSTGGTGATGNSANGTQGDNGADGISPSPGSSGGGGGTADNGGAGGPGSAGDTGWSGHIGGASSFPSFSSAYMAITNLYSRGKNGGNGGDGGIGGDAAGGSGGSGGSAWDDGFGSPVNGADGGGGGTGGIGGTGGTAGDGGAGGDGGTITYDMSNVTVSGYAVDAGTGGASGTGGGYGNAPGGAGGAGGGGVNGGSSGNSGSMGSAGSTGSVGGNGSSGASGVAGSVTGV